MKKIISLFKRNYEGNRKVYNEIVPGAEWVINGEGIATVKIDGTCCMISSGKLYKRYDRKLTKKNHKRLRSDKNYVPQIEDYKAAPENWIAAEDKPNHHTGHWPGWVPVENKPEDKWHNEAFEIWGKNTPWADGTYELIGPKIQANPYKNDTHRLIPHGQSILTDAPRSFDKLSIWFKTNIIEGIVWHHPDGRMVKIRRSDFGLEWPVKGGDA